jgi:ATP-dependent DNA helicase RecQ
MDMTAKPNSPENRALNYLRLSLNDPKAAFRPGQWDAIEALVYKKSKLLVVQKTGWGKSVIYFLATRLLREEGSGPTLLVSPLLSLIRNQLEMADRLGIRAYSINSTNREEWKSIEEMLQANLVDILLISPERLANEEFLNKYLNRINDDKREYEPSYASVFTFNIPSIVSSQGDCASFASVGIPQPRPEAAIYPTGFTRSF